MSKLVYRTQKSDNVFVAKLHQHGQLFGKLRDGNFIPDHFHCIDFFQRLKPAVSFGHVHRLCDCREGSTTRTEQGHVQQVAGAEVFR